MVERRSLQLLVDAHNELSQGVNSLGEKKLSHPDIDGALVGGASFEARSFDQHRAGGASNE